MKKSKEEIKEFLIEKWEKQKKSENYSKKEEEKEKFLEMDMEEKKMRL